MFRQRQNVTGPFVQSRPAQREDVETIVEIFAKQAILYRFFQIPVAGGDDPHIQRDHLATTEPLHLFLLQHPQQFGLQPLIHLGDLVKQQGAPPAPARTCRGTPVPHR